VHARLFGEAAVILGGGRARKGDQVDHAVGLIIHRNVGERVDIGEPLFTIHANEAVNQVKARAWLREAIGWSDQPVTALPLFYE
jgi:pyrimidine-nucleoside phosphorylase